MKGSYSSGKGSWPTSWQQQHNGIKSFCAIAEKPKPQVDLQGFEKPLRTARPQPVVSSAFVNGGAKFFPVEIQDQKETEKGFPKCRKFAKFRKRRKI